MMSLVLFFSGLVAIVAGALCAFHYAHKSFCVDYHVHAVGLVVSIATVIAGIVLVTMFAGTVGVEISEILLKSVTANM